MLFISSADAYGGASPSGASIHEAAPLAPSNLYAATKAAADLALGSMIGQGLRLVRLRPFNHTGPGQSANLVIPAFARQVARISAGRQAPLLEVGNLDPWRDFLDVRDVCAAYLACIERRDTLAPGSIINIGSGLARRIGDVLAELMELGVSPPRCARRTHRRGPTTLHAPLPIPRAPAPGWAGHRSSHGRAPCLMCSTTGVRTFTPRRMALELWPRRDWPLLRILPYPRRTSPPN